MSRGDRLALQWPVRCCRLIFVVPSSIGRSASFPFRSKSHPEMANEDFAITVLRSASPVEVKKQRRGRLVAFVIFFLNQTHMQFGQWSHASATSIVSFRRTCPCTGSTCKAESHMRQQISMLTSPSFLQETLASPEQLSALHDRKNHLAALDYTISIASDVFVATFPGNMAKAVEGYRRLSGHRKTINLNRRELVPNLDGFMSGNLDVETFQKQVVEIQGHEYGQARSRRKGVKGGGELSRQEERKEEENFYANPLPDCLCDGATRRARRT
jgi:hypothetical protein